MTKFQTGVVVSILRERPGLQRVEVRIDGITTRAYNLTQLTGLCRLGDQVVCNTTAVELGLGTGGWHVVHWNLAQKTLDTGGDGHIMKMRYSSLQTNIASAEEMDPSDRSIVGVPIIVCSLHSQMAVAAAAFHAIAPTKRLGYVMTDGASLPLAFSDLVAELRSRQLLCGTVTAGHAFGGDFEAVTVPSALGVAVKECGADAVIVAMGPGVVGTGSRLGTTAIEVAPVVAAAKFLQARPIVAIRASSGDQRTRHLGISHHTITALAMCAGADLPVPLDDRAMIEEIPPTVIARHTIVPTDIADPAKMLSDMRLHVSSMGRDPGADAAFFRFASAAGTHAARIVEGPATQEPTFHHPTRDATTQDPTQDATTQDLDTNF
jgi:hypothetical protein